MTEEGFFLGLGFWPNVDIDMDLLVFYTPQSPLKILLFGSSDREEGFGDIRPTSWLAKSPLLAVLEPFHLPEAHSWL